MKYILTVGLRFYEGQIYLISPKFIINTKEKLKKKNPWGAHATPLLALPPPLPESKEIHSHYREVT